MCIGILVIVSRLAAQTYTVTRLNGALPVMTHDMFVSAGATETEAENMNGPSVIRIPDWISPDNRTSPEAVYYMYFAAHRGNYIRLAWAVDLEGPWHLYNIGQGIPVGTRGVLDLGVNDQIYIGNNIAVRKHVASADVHIDYENQQIILYFHGPSLFAGSDAGQQNFVALSPDGLDFNGRIEQVVLGKSYFRVFEYNDEMYALDNGADLWKARDPLNPWMVPAGFNYANPLWLSADNDPFADDLITAGLSADVRVRHVAVRVVGDLLHVFYSRRGDAPERIQMSTIDLGIGDYELWDSSYPPEELLHPEMDWEGADFPVEPSEGGSAPEHVNQLRDPCFFEDIDGSLYLFYAAGGEDAIGIAALEETGLSAADPVQHLTPYSFELMQNYPNPFNSETIIRFSIPEAAEFTMKIYDHTGREVRSLETGYAEAGMHESVWDGRSNRGDPVTSGIYTCRLQTGLHAKAIKMMLVR
ncbi:hypothetical protein BVY01_01780 [bacterium I07]|nr:hypothetical protein BVY01_01780 [bacterium I07]